MVTSIGDNANLCANDVQNYERNSANVFNEINGGDAALCAYLQLGRGALISNNISLSEYDILSVVMPFSALI